VKIVQANKYHFVKGGAERYYLDLSEGLAQRGHLVMPFAMKHARNEPSPYDRYFVPEVDYHGSLSLGEKIQAARDSIYSRTTVEKMKALIADEAPQIVHMHNIYHQLSPSLVHACADEGVPMVQTLHDYKLVCPGYLLMTGGKICERCIGKNYFNAVKHKCLMNSTAASIVGYLEATFHEYKKTYSKIDYYLCPSEFLKRKVAEFGVPEEKLIHFPYFLPIDAYEPNYGPSNYFIYLGRLSREKGILTLLKAVQLMKGTRLKCRILGEGPLEAQLKAQAEEWGLENIEFSGFLQGNALQTLIREAAFTVVPSEWYENLPFAVLESFALGTPVVGSKIGGIPEMVLHEQTGLTYTPRQPHELAAALDWMESHSDSVVEMGREARKLIEERYAPEAHLERMEELYRQVIQ
jgi:glycosyltransferase involved in cell wall biosynthesis